MKFELEPLPYAEDALEPYISRQTLQYHYGKHHQGYMRKLKDAISDTPEAEKTLEELIKHADSEAVYNLTAQVWNHSFYWQCLSANGGGQPPAGIEAILNKYFDSFDEFKSQFAEVANSQFGSGWAWLVKDQHDQYRILGTGNADNPMSQDLIPILTLDVWEHAYYLDYQNARADYVNVFFEHLINWNFIHQRITEVAS